MEIFDLTSGFFTESSGFESLINPDAISTNLIYRFSLVVVSPYIFAHIKARR